MGVFKQFSSQTVVSLEKMPDREEIREAIWSCDSNKAPGYDGFILRFIKEMWDTVREDIISFVQNFFTSGQFPQSINTTWVSLIPKIKNPEVLEEYWPISVVGSLYKIVSKLLANRIKPVISEVISHTQTGFIQDSFITDGILIANVIVMWLKRKKSWWSV